MNVLDGPGNAVWGDLDPAPTSRVEKGVMRAWQVRQHGEPRKALQIVEHSAPAPRPRMLRVRVSVAALGLPDLYMCRGWYALTPPLPFTPGQELVGVVTEAGEGTQARVGQRVMAVSAFFTGYGGFAEEALALDDFAFPAPDFMSDEESAGFLIPYHTAYVGLVRRAELKPGENLLVLGGSGGTGSAAIQLGRALGAKVLATAGGSAKAAFCRDLGADPVIDHRSQNVAETVLEATGGVGAHVIYDPVGGDAFREATRCIAHEGRLLVVGFASGRWGTPDAAHLTTRNYSVMGVMPGGYDRAFRECAQEALLSQYRAGTIRVPLHRSLDFRQLPRGLEDLANSVAMGKIVLRN